MKLRMIRDDGDGRPMWWVDVVVGSDTMPLVSGRSEKTAWSKAERALKKLHSAAVRQANPPTV